MPIDLSTLDSRYTEYCKRHSVLLNPAIFSALFEGHVNKARNEPIVLTFCLDHLKDADFRPLLNLFMEIDASEVDAVDIVNGSSCVLDGEYAFLLMCAVNQKLRLVDLWDLSLGKNFLRNLSRQGFPCQILNLRSSHFRKLNLVGNFTYLHTLNLDFSIALSSFHEDCFTCMPSLVRLSMCETKVANLWTTSAALSKLPNLEELRFQSCSYSIEAGPARESTSGAENEEMDTGQLDHPPYVGALTMDDMDLVDSRTVEALRTLFFLGDEVMNGEDQSSSDNSSDDSEVDFSSHQTQYSMVSNGFPRWNRSQNEVSLGTSWNQGGDFNLSASSDISSTKYISKHPSPICFEKHYREYMIASLPRLTILDDMPITKTDRESANTIYAQYFEYLPYKRKHKESMVSILKNRETITNGRSRKSQHFFSRSLCAAKVGSTQWPFSRTLTTCNRNREGRRKFRPRQFEYHPSNSSLMVIGTLDGEVVVINHESDRVVNYVTSLRAMNSVLGLCWLKQYPSKLIAGSDDGSLKLFDIQHMPSTFTDIYSSGCSTPFDKFEQLTSVHVNSTDELFLASGYSTNVALYDIDSGRCIEVLTDLHREHINVVKFANHSPFIFATSSFDHDVKMWDLRQKPLRPCHTTSSSRGNVMVCFSPDDHYLLVSAVDNEVKQLLAVDGRLHLNFEIPAIGSVENYTRSYYLNGRDYIISGSCDEHVVRICCAQTGKRLRDISLEGKSSRASMFVQSLRGDPFRDFNMSILATYPRPGWKSEIVKVNLLASSDHNKEDSYCPHSCASTSMGG